MMNILQIPMIAIFALGSLLHAAGEKKFEWDPLDIKTSIFSQDLVMLNTERDEYATNLAAYAANEILANKATLPSISRARRIIALALHLSPRNRQAVVTQFQLGKGILPVKTDADYSPQVLARLLLTRGQLLLQQTEVENTTLARYLISLSAEIDPHNEDAVYASELIRIDHGTPDWKILTDPKKADNIADPAPARQQQP
ncbi:MAG: hypothetical protein OSA84_03080 [Akkermansiaceae bacterium]|nr:hypothetical protein [Akkermansiaceae bacterium]